MAEKRYRFSPVAGQYLLKTITWQRLCKGLSGIKYTASITLPGAVKTLCGISCIAVKK
jgi:hypothetical protein